MIRKNITTKGFTLIEIIVSLAIFTTVSVIAVGALLSVINANKKAQSLKTSINNVNFFLDTFSRELRTGKAFHCDDAGAFSIAGESFVLSPRSCSAEDAPWTLAFYSARTAPKSSGGRCNLITAYRYEEVTDVNGVLRGVLKKAEQSTCGQGISSSASETSGFNPRPFATIMSPDIRLTFVGVSVETGNNTTIGQPRAFLHLKGYSGTRDNDQTTFDVQTSVSQRIND